jgi:hypothetical protein
MREHTYFQLLINRRLELAISLPIRVFREPPGI